MHREAEERDLRATAFRSVQMRSILTGILVSVPYCVAAAQGDVTKSPKRLSLTAVVGSARSNSSHDLEEAMSSAGYREAFGGCDIFICVPARRGPESYTHANPSLFVIRYEVAEGRALELMLGGSASGTTSGRSTAEILDVGYGGTIIAPMLSAGSPAVRVSAGPAFLLSSWDYRSPDNSNAERVRRTSLGLVGSAAVRWPTKSRFFAEGTAQYRVFGPVSVRPSQAERPAGRVSVSHSFVGAGFGLALR